MKRIVLGCMLCLLSLALSAQSLNSNQVRINGKTFTIGSNTYDADYPIIVNQWYKGHKNAEEAKPGEDLSWVNDFTRTYTLKISENGLSIGENSLDHVKIIAFSREGWVRGLYGELGGLNINQWLVYDGKTGKLIGAQFHVIASNVYQNIGPQFFDMPVFLFPLTVGKINAPVSAYDVNRGFFSYKEVYEYQSAGTLYNGVIVCMFSLNSAMVKKLKDADDLARTMKKEIEAPMGVKTARASSLSATHSLTADLNVFADQDGGSTLVESLKKGSLVQVMGYGDYADWNGVTAKWAQVRTENGKTGWLFSAYLEPLRR